jgi:hypothetical protein
MSISGSVTPPFFSNSSDNLHITALSLSEATKKHSQTQPESISRLDFLFETVGFDISCSHRL